MTYEIRAAKPRDALGLGFVHCTSWQETYKGLIDDEFLATLSPEKSAKRFAERKCKDMLALAVDGHIVGLSAFGKTRDSDLPENVGDIHAIYILKAYQKLGYGRKLLEVAIDSLRSQGFNVFSIWVLESNTSAMAFYEKCGFQFDGTTQEVVYTTPVTCKRFILM